MNAHIRLPTMKTFVAAAAAAGLLAAPAGAVVVAPGGASALGGTTVAANPNLAGVVQNDNLIAFSITDGSGNVVVSGNLQNRVARSDNLGTLIFAPILRDLVYATGASITRLIVQPYGGGVLDIDFRTDGLGTSGPSVVTRSASGDTLTFDYANPPLTGGQSLSPSILSTATIFSLTGTAQIFARNAAGGEFSTTLTGIAAPGQIPIPAAAPLFLSALAGGAFAARRRRV
jgi:hypothetical protein